MQFDDFEIDADMADLKERLSSWRQLPGVVEHSLGATGEPSINEAEVRMRQRRFANMCLNTVRVHDAYVADLKAYIENANGNRDSHHQNRVEDEGAFSLGVFEQVIALALQKGIENELNNLPTEVIQTVTVPAPPPPRSWFQRMLGI